MAYYKKGLDIPTLTCARVRAHIKKDAHKKHIRFQNKTHFKFKTIILKQFKTKIEKANYQPPF